MDRCKPIMKWAGGKSQLLTELLPRIPNYTGKYIEPFFGGGALYLAFQPENAVIADSNPELINLYKQVAGSVDTVIEKLKHYENAKEMFYEVRAQDWTKLTPEDAAARTIYLNRTCFNGLYRVNKSGLFNVPFGKYSNPLICDPETIRRDSELLQRVEILTGDFEKTFDYANGNTLFYFDPPYRPLSETSSFNDYAKEAFNDDAQIRLKEFCDRINNAGFKFMLSNSDCKGKDEKDKFFDVLYEDYQIEKVWASRSINSNPNKRGKLTEILVHNYLNTKSVNIDRNVFNAIYLTERKSVLAQVAN